MFEKKKFELYYPLEGAGCVFERSEKAKAAVGSNQFIVSAESSRSAEIL